jgi:hypothetical protein
VDVIAAVLVHLLHGHFRRDAAERGDELAGEQGMQALLLGGAAPERGGGDGDGFGGRGDADVELGLDVDAHAVLGDQRLVLLPGDRHLQHVHVDGRDVVDDRPHEGAAVDHHLFPEEAGADERDFLGGPAVEPGHHPVDHGDHDDRGDDPQNELSD